MVMLKVNGHDYDVPDENMPLLWALRDIAGLKGTKFGCGAAQCGACTVHVDGSAVRACITTVGSIEGKPVTTIEGLSEEGDHPVQRAWLEMSVPQCGYCQAGQIMCAAALLAKNPKPSDEDITKGMSGNLCRCGTYQRIRAAVARAAELGAEEGKR
jgi:aerobic-type carbon monoxide dehydrogenase small subunit (CoxS/CutS family)